MSLANGLSILFIFSKNQLLAFLIFAMVSLVSFAFISALIFKISFLLLTLGDRVEREWGGGIGMGNTCKSMADSFQCMTKPTTIL